MAKSQNELLNAVKGVACVCVVFLHCEFPGVLGILVQTVSRFSVPFFFMISGYYCFYATGITPGSKMKAKLKHIAVICINSTIFYLIAAYVSGKQMTIGGMGGVNWIVFNSPCIVVGQLWFLFALLYDYLLYAVINKYKVHHMALCFVPMLFLAYFVMAQGLYLMGVSVPNMYYRNWLIEGFAFFMMGYWIHKNSEKLKIRNSILILILIVSTIACVVERYYMGRDFGVNFFSIPQVFALFLLATNNTRKKESMLSVLGKRYSMYVYILHPFVWNVIKLFYSKIKWDDSVYGAYAMPILVVIATIILSHFVYMGNKRMKLITRNNA